MSATFWWWFLGLAPVAASVGWYTAPPRGWRVRKKER